MESFIEKIQSQTGTILRERSADILRAWHENIEEAQECEKPLPPLKLAISAVVDLEDNAVSTELRFSVVYKTKLTSPLPDPNQLDLPEFE